MTLFFVCVIVRLKLLKASTLDVVDNNDDVVIVVVLAEGSCLDC